MEKTREIEYIESSIVKDRIKTYEILLKIKVKIDIRFGLIFMIKVESIYRVRGYLSSFHLHSNKTI